MISVKIYKEGPVFLAARTLKDIRNCSLIKPAKVFSQ